MNKVQGVINNRTTSTSAFNRLPVNSRESAAAHKYAEAVDLYAMSDLTLRQVAEMCGVTPVGLSAHIGKHHRSLLFARYGLDINNPSLAIIKVKQPNGQSLKTHLKYKDAIEACGDVAYIEYNITQIARLFGLDGTALASQLRVHYPDVIPTREALRQRLGIADNIHRGARPTTVDQYDDAVKMYRDTDMTVTEVADRCNLSKGGLVQYMRFYHKDVISDKAQRRASACGSASIVGQLAGNGSLYGPQPQTVSTYAEALDLYRTTTMTLADITDLTGVPAEGFRFYVNRWHKDDALRRRSKTPASGKYSRAIASLKADPRLVAKVADEFGLNADVFREYLKAHEPELAARQGMKRLDDGRKVKQTSYDKYLPAVREYAESAIPLKDIAARYGLVYKSLNSFINRNCPEAKASHNNNIKSA